MHPYRKMAGSGFDLRSLKRDNHFSMRLLFSYAFDWVVIVLVAVTAILLGRIEPAKRPFSLVDPNISFPFTEHELVPPYLLLILNAVVPIIIVAIVSLIFVPGPTVPKDTPKLLIWKRKLWELHVGLLGLALALVSAWWFTEAMKNIFGKPRPDLLSRCKPDIENYAQYVVGGFNFSSMNGQLVSADICTQTDSHILNDGFRSYPSGHSSSAAAGLIYASLFLASKFAVTIPFVMPAATAAAAASGAVAHAAFPSRLRSDLRSEVDPYEPSRAGGIDNRSSNSSPTKAAPFGNDTQQQNAKIQSLRRQAASPPIYLLVLTLVPFVTAVFVASSRWYDYRHHGFDILFGFTMGTITSIYSFRYYHLPIRAGAGWAWGPRSRERAFWAGVGRLGYAGEDDDLTGHTQHRSTGLSANTSYPSATSALAQRNAHREHDVEADPRPGPSFQDVELQRMQRDQVHGVEGDALDANGMGGNRFEGRI